MDKLKAIVTIAVSFLSSLLGILFIPVCLLAASNLLDYATGLMASPNRGEKIKSYKSIKGIFKKVGMWLLIVAGALVDTLIKYSTEVIGLNFPFTFMIACVVAVWLICNEIISILENIADIGTPLPPFLTKVVYYVKDQIETTTDIDNDTKEEKGHDRSDIERNH